MDESAKPYKKLKYVFDVSQTTALYPEAMPKRWEITDRYEATDEEQAVLVQYVGWGGLSQVFRPEHAKYAELKNLLTDKEYQAARATVLNAYYTSPVIIDEMYQALQNMGFEGGKILEPSCGVGNFIGRLPENLDKMSAVTGIEIDDLTARIAKQLYPNADIQSRGFETANIKNNSFDIAIGNVPFGDYSVYDPKYNKQNFRIHDYFFSKSLELIKPGGVVAFIHDAANEAKKEQLFAKVRAGEIRVLIGSTQKMGAGTNVQDRLIASHDLDCP